MKLFDLHCDTPFELYHKKQRLQDNDLHVSLKKAEVFERYIQCAAVWSDSKRTDGQCLSDFENISEYFKNEARGLMIESSNELERASIGFILTVEDMRVIDSDISRVCDLYNKGVRVGTLMWGGKSSLGASHDTEGSLTPLGKDTVLEMLSLGIIPDISHANDKTSKEILDLAKGEKKPVIVTHSNSRSVHPHTRNLPDCLAEDIANAEGIIGLSLFPPHLKGEKANISDVISHIAHYVRITGTDCTCLGCDFDGIGSTPEGLDHIGMLPNLFEALARKLGSSTAEKIFFNNAYNFFINNLPQKERSPL